MTPLVSCREASRLDAATVSDTSIPSIILMEDASLRLWDKVRALAEARGAGAALPMLALCGPGNNGGDALAILRHARFAGMERIAAVLAKEPGELASVYASSLRAIGVEVLDWSRDREACLSRIGEASLIIDGLSGTGLKGALGDPMASLLAAANDAVMKGGTAIASIDLPSGLSDGFKEGDLVAEATWTLSVEPRKACLYFPLARERCGEIVPVGGVFPHDAAIAPLARLLEESDLGFLAPLPGRDSHKGVRGKVAVFAGSEGASGAAILSSRSALAAGAGVVSLFASKELFPIAAPMLDAIMVKREPEDFGSLDLSRFDAALAGPGWGRGERRREQLRRLLRTGVPVVLDADAIHLFRELVDSGFTSESTIVLTPHPAEFAALTGMEPGIALASPAECLGGAVAGLGATIVLKSQVTWIASPTGELAAWDGRECGLGTAGSGDVLAGLTAGLLASRLARAKASKPLTRESPAEAAFAAARAAVLAHGLAGRRAREERGWFEAGAIVEEAARLLGRR